MDFRHIKLKISVILIYPSENETHQVDTLSSGEFETGVIDLEIVNLKMVSLLGSDLFANSRIANHIGLNEIGVYIFIIQKICR